MAVGKSYELRRGDCLDPKDGLSSLATASVDLVVTDPPYVVGGSAWNGQTPRFDYQFFAHWFRSVAAELVRITKPAGCAFVFCDWRTAGVVAAAFGEGVPYEIGWAVSQVLVWDRDAIGMGSPFRNAYEMIAFARGPKYQRSRIPRDIRTVLRHRWPYGRHPHHPAEKPLQLVRQLVTWGSDPGETIVDPFAGSATVGAAALGLGRRFLGWEIDPRFHAGAEARLNGTAADLDRGQTADPEGGRRDGTGKAAPAGGKVE